MRTSDSQLEKPPDSYACGTTRTATAVPVRSRRQRKDPSAGCGQPAASCTMCQMIQAAGMWYEWYESGAVSNDPGSWYAFSLLYRCFHKLINGF